MFLGRERQFIDDYGLGQYRFQGGNASTAAVTTRGADENFYRIYMTATGDPAAASVDSQLINTCCAHPACASDTEICDNTDGDALNDCTAAAAGSSTAWADPWSGRPSPGCTGTDCGTQDTAVELSISWGLVGGEPVDGQSVFLDYASSPSGPGQGQKDDTGASGWSARIRLDSLSVARPRRAR